LNITLLTVSGLVQFIGLTEGAVHGADSGLLSDLLFETSGFLDSERDTFEPC
jgi:hypothetical protein